jgi:hypothetical protein
LIEHRKAAHDALEQLGLHVIGIESFGARPEDSTTACLREVEESDLFVGIYAHRYGYIPKDATASITEQEFDYAKKLGKPIFGFIVEDEFIWHQKYWEHDKKAKLDAFLNKVKNSPLSFSPHLTILRVVLHHRLGIIFPNIPIPNPQFTNPQNPLAIPFLNCLTSLDAPKNLKLSRLPCRMNQEPGAR